LRRKTPGTKPAFRDNKKRRQLFRWRRFL